MARFLHRLLFIGLDLAFTICLNNNASTKFSNEAENTIKFAFGMFRHGIKSPIDMSYNNITYKNYDKLFPDGMLELTKKGKERIYKVGKCIKHRYSKLLGDMYKPDVVKFHSTDTDRAIMSAQIVAHAIYPPKTYQKWGENQTWQPIPIWPDHGEINKINPMFKQYKCKRYWQLREKAEEKMAVSDIKELFLPLTQDLGNLIMRPLDLLFIWDNLFYLDLNGIELPLWSKKYYPKTMRNTYNQILKSWIADTPEMLNLTTGILFHFIKHHLLNKENNTLVPDRNMILFGGHDSSLAGLLYGIGYNDSLETYPGATLVFELHDIDNTHIVKAFYLDIEGKDEIFREIPISNCAKPCTLHSFLTSIQSMNQKQWTKQCSSVQMKNFY